MGPNSQETAEILKKSLMENFIFCAFHMFIHKILVRCIVTDEEPYLFSFYIWFISTTKLTGQETRKPRKKPA